VGIAWRLLRWVLLGLSLGLAFALPAAAEPVVLVGNSAVPPKAWLDGDRPRGFAVDAAVAALRRAGLEPEVRLFPLARAIEMAKGGGVIITGLYRTPERERIFDFSLPLVDDEVLVVTRKGEEFDFRSAADLLGRRVAYQQGASYGAEFAAVAPQLGAETDNAPSQRLMKLAAGRLDAALINPGRAALVFHLRQTGLDPDMFSVLPVPLVRQANHIAIAKGRDPGGALMARIDAAIAALRAEGALDAIMHEYNFMKVTALPGGP